MIGGGNLFRGAKGHQDGIDQGSADQMGMMATVINGIALQRPWTRPGPTRGTSRPSRSSRWPSRSSAGGSSGTWRRADHHLLRRHRLSVLHDRHGRRAEGPRDRAEIIFKATKVDGVYSSDPVKDKRPSASKRSATIDVLRRTSRSWTPRPSRSAPTTACHSRLRPGQGAATSCAPSWARPSAPRLLRTEKGSRDMCSRHVSRPARASAAASSSKRPPRPERAPRPCPWPGLPPAAPLGRSPTSSWSWPTTWPCPRRMLRGDEDPDAAHRSPGGRWYAVHPSLFRKPRSAPPRAASS